MYAALREFGAPLEGLTVGDLATPGVVFQIGVEADRIDILTAIDGVDFDEAWGRRSISSYGGVPIALLAIEDLIRNKRTAARPQDLLDVAKLEAALRARPQGKPAP